VLCAKRGAEKSPVLRRVSRFSALFIKKDSGFPWCQTDADRGSVCRRSGKICRVFETRGVRFVSRNSLEIRGFFAKSPAGIMFAGLPGQTSGLDWRRMRSSPKQTI
jgi:hypothetical protein